MDKVTHTSMPSARQTLNSPSVQHLGTPSPATPSSNVYYLPPRIPAKSHLGPVSPEPSWL